MSGWLFHRLGEKIAQGRHLRKCRRCRIMYEKSLPACPHCSDVDDARLGLLLAERKKQRLSLGRGMLVAAAVIIILIFVLNSV